MSGPETNLKSTRPRPRPRPPAKGRDRDPENWSRDLHYWYKDSFDFDQYHIGASLYSTALR